MDVDLGRRVPHLLHLGGEIQKVARSITQTDRLTGWEPQATPALRYFDSSRSFRFGRLGTPSSTIICRTTPAASLAP